MSEFNTTSKNKANVSQKATPTVQTLLKKCQIALEFLEWGRADDFCEYALEQDPSCVEAYIGKLCAHYQVDSFEKYIEKFKERLSSPATKNLNACKEDKGHIDSIVEKYAINSFLEEEKIRKSMNSTDPMRQPSVI